MDEDPTTLKPHYGTKAGEVVKATKAVGEANAADAVKAFVGLGANLGDRQGTLSAALAAINGLPGTRVVRASPLYRTAPVGAGGPDYLNAVAELATGLAPHALLKALQTIEQAAGRERPYRNAPRTLDLDVLWFDDRTLATADLTVPHPRMTERAFVLRPLADIAPEWVAAAALQAVAGQAIERLHDARWSELFVSL